MEITSVKKSTSKIIRISPAGKSTSYDFTVKDTHRILANGFYTSNCAHPEIETFINIKRDLKKVTGANISIRLTDEFMNAVKSNSSFTLQWPVDAPIEEAKVTKVVKAQDIWNQIIDAAWTSAEPGLLFWDTVKRRTPTEAYASVGYGSVSTNPCVTGDTQVAVADGRGYVPIGELAAAGIDVPVYAYDNDTGKIIIKTMRNPRLTGNNMPVYNVTIEGGHSFRATGNHKMILRDGSKKSVQELLPGESLWVAQKAQAKFSEALPWMSATQSQDYLWIKDCNSKSWKSEHRIIWEANNNVKIKHNEVIHHIDFNAKNNNLENLLLMSREDHNSYHSSLIKGKNNPIFKIKADPERFAEYSAKMSASTSGLNNPRAFDVTNAEIFDHIRILTKQIGRRANCYDWISYAEKNSSLPRYLNEFRFTENNFSDIAKECQIPDELINIDSRTARRALEAQNSGYRWRVNESELEIERKCEWCDENFWNRYDRREISFCGHSCSNFYANRKAGKNTKRAASLQKMHNDRAAITRLGQLNTFTKLRFELSREPLIDEWILACKKNGFPSRIGTKNGFSSWKNLKNEASLHNHRVVSVEFAGYEDVYNGTVDDVHTFCFKVGHEKLEGFNNNVDILLANEQCGELVLSPYDSCRLLLINLYKFVKNPFSSAAAFDNEKFKSVSQKAQRLMDDLVDLEIEAVNKILSKIENDPESVSVKRAEVELWQKIKTATSGGRRTGLGITALGDALAAMNFVYGSDHSITMTESIYKALCINAYRSTVQMAKERGTFSAYSYDLEAEHPFIKQVMDSDEDLASDHKKYGRRNIALTTTAPAGSVSVLTQTTSGIEPAFLLSYKRRKKVNGEDSDSRVDFIDPSGDKWQEYKVYHHAFKKWMEVTGKSEEQSNESPYWGGTSNDVNWSQSVKLQAAAQRHVCHSISKTCNLPNDASKDLVAQVYMNAWESGCKGFTVYRDGCRTGVLVADTSTEEATMLDGNQPTKVIENHAPKRPKELPCDIHRINVRGSGVTESYLVLVGKLDGNPYEVFCGLANHVEVPKKAKTGVIIKNGKKDGVATYNLRIPYGDDDVLLFKDVVELFANPNYGSFTRTLSLALRHGVPVSYVVEQLQKDKHSDMQSFSRVIARVLKSHIPDGTKSMSDKKCGGCSADDGLVYQEGCLLCKYCGYSKCG
jgi:ribonucleotide reductase alpha subunit